MKANTMRAKQVFVVALGGEPEPEPEGLRASDSNNTPTASDTKAVIADYLGLDPDNYTKAELVDLLEAGE